MATSPLSPAPGPAEFSLTPQGEFAGKPAVRFSKPVVLVGSDERCHLHLVSSSVSRHHALFVREDDRMHVFDLGSRTKVLVNGRAQREAELADGDVVRIGKFSFKFGASRPAAGPAVRPEPVRLIVDGQVVPTPPENRLILIGRTAGCDVTLVEESVSSRHAVIFEVGNKRYLRDLDSRTGTFLNGKKTHQHEFKLGDDLRVGETAIKLAQMFAPTEVEEGLPPVIEEPLPFESEAIEVADEPKPSPAAVSASPAGIPLEEVIPLVPAKSEPPEPSAEPVLELEPEPVAGDEPKTAPEPSAAAVDHLDDLLDLLPEPAMTEAAGEGPLPVSEPEHPEAAPQASDVGPPLSTQPAEATEPVPAAPDHFDAILEDLPSIAELDHSETGAPPLELEPESPSQPKSNIGEPAAAVDHFDEILEELPPASETDHSEKAPLELEPELPSRPEPAAEPVTALDHFEEILEELPPASEADHSESAPLELEPEPPPQPEPTTAEPAPLAVDHFDAILEDLPGLSSDVAGEIPMAVAPASEHPDDAPLEIAGEIEPANIEEPEAPAPVLDDLGEPAEETHFDVQTSTAAEPADLGIPVVQAVVSSPIAEQEPAIEDPAAIDLSDAPEPAPVMEAVEPPAPRATSALDLLAEFAAEPQEEFKPVEFEAEPEPEPVESVGIPGAEPIDVPAAPVIAESKSEPEPAPIEQTATASAPMIDLSDAPSISEAEPEPEMQPAEQTAVTSAAAVDVSDAAAIPDLAVEPMPGEIEQTATASAPTIDLSDAPSISESEPETSQSLVETFSVVDSSKTVDLDIEAAPPAVEAEQAPINFAPLPAADEISAAAPIEEVGEIVSTADGVREAATAGDEASKGAVDASDATPEAPRPKSTRGRKRQAPAEPKPPKARRPRGKRIPPKLADEDQPAAETPVAPEPEPAISEPSVTEIPALELPPVELEAVEPVAAEPSIVESPGIELPDRSPESFAETPADSTVTISEAVSAEVTLTASADAVVPEPADAAEEPETLPIETPSVESAAIESAPVEPTPVEAVLDELPPAEPTPEPSPVNAAPIPAKPFMSVGDFAHLSGGTVNLDHSLGGMPLKLQDLPPAPAGFGQVRVNLAGKASSPFSSFAKSEPLVFDDAEAIVPPSSPPTPQAEPELIAPQPAPEPPAPMEAQLEPVVTPAPEPTAPVAPAATIEAPPQPAPIESKPIPPKAHVFADGREVRPKAAPKIPPKFSRPPRPGIQPAFGQISTAFDGLAPTFRQADAFSNVETAPLNDAAFGGARLSRSDEYNVPESPETASRAADVPEHDFADDEFWNRTDEEDGLPPSSPSGTIETPTLLTPTLRTAEDSAPSLAADQANSEPAIPPEAFADPVEQVAPIPAEPIEPEASGSGEATETADNSTMASVGPISPPQASPPHPAAPAPRRRRRFRIPFLMPILLGAIAAGLGAIWRFTPVQSQIVGKMTFGNYNWTPGTRDGTEFEASQRRLLDSDQMRRNAVEILHRDHPGVSPGFLESPDVMGKVASSVSLNSSREAMPAQTTLELSYRGENKDDDRLRILAILQSLFDANAPIVDNNRRMQKAEQQAQQVVDDTQQTMDQIKSQLASLQTVIDAQPSADEMAKLAAQKLQLEKARDAAEEAVNRDHNEIARLESPDQPVVASASTQPAAAPDPQLKQIRQQMADLAAELDSAHSDQLAGAILARQQLEKAAKQFNDQLSTADEVLGSSSQLRQFVDSARDSQAKARELINILIVDGEDLEKQLEDTRRDVEDLIEARREQKWQDDPELQQLRENLDSAQHRYNANVGDGSKDPRVLDPLQREVDKWLLLIKARQQQLGVDPSEVKVEEGLNNLVQSLRNKLQSEKQLIGQVLDPLEKQLNSLDPVVAGMPEAEQDLAHQLHQRLSALNDARQKYAETVGEGQVAPSAKVTELQRQIAELKERAARRQQEVAQQKVQSSGAEQAQNIERAKEALAVDLKNLDSARGAYDEFLTVFEEKQTQRKAAEAAQQKKINLMDAQTSTHAELEAAQRDRDEKLAAAAHAFDIKPVTDGDVIAAAPSDPRMMYSLYVLGAGVVLLAGLTFASHSAAHRAHQLGTPGHHEPPDIAKEIDSMVLPMASDPQGSQ